MVKAPGFDPGISEVRVLDPLQSNFHGPVSSAVEQRSYKATVGGSIPSLGTTSFALVTQRPECPPV